MSVTVTLMALATVCLSSEPCAQARLLNPSSMLPASVFMALPPPFLVGAALATSSSASHLCLLVLGGQLVQGMPGWLLTRGCAKASCDG